uniref:FERM domain-containing protein n=1 Tax=Heterorhabditis bacteriophora TaxID=37862 RepID=A0A1I7WHE6_HETBA
MYYFTIGNLKYQRREAANDALVSTYISRGSEYCLSLHHISLTSRNAFPHHACLVISRRRLYSMTSALTTEVRDSHLMGSSIIRISILELAMLLKVPTHELGQHFLESRTLFHLLRTLQELSAVPTSTEWEFAYCKEHQVIPGSHNKSNRLMLLILIFYLFKRGVLYLQVFSKFIA